MTLLLRIYDLFVLSDLTVIKHMTMSCRSNQRGHNLHKQIWEW